MHQTGMGKGESKELAISVVDISLMGNKLSLPPNAHLDYVIVGNQSSAHWESVRKQKTAWQEFCMILVVKGLTDHNPSPACSICPSIVLTSICLSSI